MEVTTDTDEIKKIRKTLIELLLSNHPNDCMRCERTGDCKLQNLSYEYGVDGSRFEGRNGSSDKRGQPLYHI
jgi:NADH dehydrogenase/NADH:ubiquinone oxidoreductase subunit G